MIVYVYVPFLLNVNLLNVAFPSALLVTVSSYAAIDGLVCSSLSLNVNSPAANTRPSSCFSTSGITDTGSPLT